jgi:hypothetical protein
LGPRTHFESDPKPVDLRLTGNPLDYAGRRIGLDVRRVELPRGHEGGYRFAARFPLIDFVSNRPLYMKTWTEKTADRITVRHREKGLEALNEAAAVLRGTGAFPRKLPDVNADLLSAMEKKLSASPFTPPYRERLGSLLRAFLAARTAALRAQVRLTDADRKFFDANPGYFLAPDGKKMPSLTGNVDSQFAFLERARKVVFEDIFLASHALALAVKDYLSKKGKLTPEGVFTDPKRSKDRFRLETPAGVILVSGFGPDVHEEETAFLIDLGGDDTYRNNAGGCASSGAGAALCIDHGGNDRYEAPGRSFVQGFGFLGVGTLVDLGGDDRYTAKHFCQGAGILGVGALWDGSGDDVYTAHAFCQGAGMFGLGLLLDTRGEDFFDGATLCQGGATTLGLGILSDLEGDDRYHLNVGAGKDHLGSLAGYGQGGGLSFRHYPWRGKLTAYGGVGMLLDASGNDRYRSKGWCDQGGSYIMSLGALVDGAGNDHYSCHTGQGSGIHITNAILIDRGGHDVYEGGFRTGGSGGDRSPGILIDYKGNDIYKPRTSSYGTGCKPFSFSLFIDYEGEDTYVCARPKGKITFNNWDSFGGVWPESAPHLWPYAICLDLGGKDTYRVRNRRNDSERHSFGHGIHIDMEWTGGDVIGEVENPLPPQEEIPLPEGIGSSPLGEGIRGLQHPDTFTRFQVVRRIVDAGSSAIPVLAEVLRDSTHRSFNRDLMECVHYFFVQNAVSGEAIPPLLSLLRAKDAEVRTLMADNFGVWKIQEAEDALLGAATKDAAPSVREFALRSLLALESKKGLSVARALACEDPAEAVRRIAVVYVQRVRDDADPLALYVKILEEDTSPAVRVAAAEGIGALENPDGIEPLRRAAKTFDVYVQRAAGKALAGLFQVEGIEILIRSFSFPSIDAFYNYNYNVANFLAAYTGHDFPEKERYKEEVWLAWFEKNRDNIDLRTNVKAYRAFSALQEGLRALAPEAQIEKLEAFLKAHPGNRRAGKTLARILNQVAWDKVTAAKGTPAFDPKMGLGYAQRCVELDPHPNYVDTLAEAYLANGDVEKAAKICREMLKKKPGQKMFLDRLARLKALKEGQAKTEWLVTQSGRFRIFYRHSFEDAATRVGILLNIARVNLLKEFPSRALAEELDAVDFRVYLYAKRTRHADEVKTSIVTEVQAGTYCATLHLYGPTARRQDAAPSGKTRGGELLHLLVHEVSAVVLDLFTRTKKEGWGFFQAPTWFVQGYEEYLGRTLSGTAIRAAFVGPHLKEKLREAGRVRLTKSEGGWSFSAKDVYGDGAILLLFLHETFGKERVQAILASEAKTFSEAVTGTLGITWEALFDRWTEWVKAQREKAK